MANKNDDKSLLEGSNETTVVAEKPQPLSSFLQVGTVVKVKPYENTAYTDELVKHKGKVKIDLFHNAKQSFDVPVGRGGHVERILDNGEAKYTEEIPTEALTEQQFFERMLGRDLDILKIPADNFWMVDPLSKVYIKREGLTLNLGNVIDMLHYKILVNNKSDFALNYVQGIQDGAFATFYFEDEKKAKKSEIDKILAEGKASRIFAALVDSKDAMEDFLKVAGKVNNKASKDWLQQQLLLMYEDSAKTGFERFLAIAEDPMFKQKVLAADGVLTKVIERQGDDYYIESNHIGTLNDVISFLRNPANAPIVQAIQSMKNRV